MLSTTIVSVTDCLILGGRAGDLEVFVSSNVSWFVSQKSRRLFTLLV